MIAALLTHLWQSTLFAAAAGLLTLAFRRNRAQVRYGLWLTASLKFFIPFALLISLGSHLNWAPAAQKIATPAISFAVEYVAQPISFAPAQITTPARDGTPLILTAIWSIGFLAIALIRLRLWLRVRATVRQSKPLDIPSAVEIREAAGLLEPGVVGLWRPTLLLPEGIVDRLTPDELEAVIAHELCHIRRRDNLLSSIHMAVEALFWFHPLVWWIGAHLLEERERACDETVLTLGNQPRVYADAILNVCKLYTESPLVCVSGVTGSDIKKRIETIMRNRIGLKLNSAKKLLLATAAVTALAAPIAVGVLIAVGHLPEIHAQSPPIMAPPAVLPTPSQAPPQFVQLATPDAPTPPLQYKDRRLVVLFFDFGGMTSEDEARLQQYAINFVNDGLKPADLVSILVAGSSGVRVAQDFTDSKSGLTSSIQNLSEGNGMSGAADTRDRLANIVTAVKMLAGFPEKKPMIYFSGGITQSGIDNQEKLLEVIAVAKQANVAIYPVDTRSTVAPAIGAVGASGRGGVPAAKPAGVSDEEYFRRVADAKQKFGSESNELARTYIVYGPPDQIDNRPSSQIWRYNYLPNFHSNVEFEFSQQRKTINYPPALATFTGATAPATALANALGEASGRGRRTASEATAVVGLPIRHATMSVYPAGEFSKLTVPLDSLSGTVDIVATIRARSAAGIEDQVVANLRDTVKLNGTPQPGAYDSQFMLQAGSYVCRLLVREAETGKTFTEAISFEVK